MSLPTGVTVITPPTMQPPTRITTTAAATPALITAYLTPILAGLNITAPTGKQVGSFVFNIANDGSSIATINWVNAT
jgi:hypothetical protein